MHMPYSLDFCRVKIITASLDSGHNQTSTDFLTRSVALSSAFVFIVDNSGNLCSVKQKWKWMPSQDAIWGIKSFHRQIHRIKRASDTAPIGHQLSRNTRAFPPSFQLIRIGNSVLLSFPPETAAGGALRHYWVA